jgi:hypothetical protein
MNTIMKLKGTQGRHASNVLQNLFSFKKSNALLHLEKTHTIIYIPFQDTSPTTSKLTEFMHGNGNLSPHAMEME